MKIHLKVHQHEGGFFSNFNKVTTFLSDNDVCKITWNLHGQPFGAFAYNCGEVFGKLFQHYNTGECNNIIELRTYNDLQYTGKLVHEKYITSDDHWRYKLNNALKYFTPTEKLASSLSKVDICFKDKKCLGVLKRNNLLKCEQVKKDNTLPSIQEYFDEIDKIIDDDTYLWLSVDNIEDLNAFIKRYKKCIYNPKIRRTATPFDMEPHFNQGSEDDAIYTYLEVYCMSKCKSLVHPLSNMSTAALYFNPALKSIYI
jgi:hypothetical protein